MIKEIKIKEIFIYCFFLLNTCCVTEFYIEQATDDGAIASECPLWSDCEYYFIDNPIDKHKKPPYIVSNPPLSVFTDKYMRETYEETFVFIDKIDGTDYYDGFILKVPKDLKIQKKGFLQYTTANGVKRTIPRISFLKKDKK